jgi:hypothetical protein
MGQAMAHDIMLLPLAAWLIGAALAPLGVWIFSNQLREKFESRPPAKVALVIPVREVPPQLADLWVCLLAQTYRPWRLIFTVESADDPAYAELRRRLHDFEGEAPAEVVVSGIAHDTGQKVWNLLAALEMLCDTDEIVVFADADIAPTSDWLQSIVDALPETGIGMVTGYRWLMPEDNKLSTELICAMNASIATLPRISLMNLAWGGTMAVRRETLDSIAIEHVWRGSILDDLPLSRAIKDHGGLVLCPNRVMVPSPVSYDWWQGIAFVRRQYLLLRLYEPLHWMIAAAATTIPMVGWIVAVPLALGGERIAIAAIAAASILDHCRAALRRRVIRCLWGEAGIERLARVLWLDRWATPLWLGFHAAMIWSTVLGRTIRWGGRVYRVDGRRSLSLLSGPV